MHLSQNIISIIIMTMMSTNIAISFCYTYKNIGNDNKNFNSHFTSADLILAFIAQFHKSWSVL